MNTRTSACCRGVVYRRSRPDQIFSCCDGSGYDSARYTCCGRSLVTRCTTRSGIYTDDCRANVRRGTTKCCPAPGASNGAGGVRCCHVDEPCCGGVGLRGGGGVACCVAGVSARRKAECCAKTAEKLGVLPKCCNKVRPYCCGAGEAMRCCVRERRRTCCEVKRRSFGRNATAAVYRSLDAVRRQRNEIATPYRRSYRGRYSATPATTSHSFYGRYARRHTASLSRGNGYTRTRWPSARVPSTATTTTTTTTKPTTTALVLAKKPTCRLPFKPSCCYRRYVYRPRCCSRAQDWCGCCGIYRQTAATASLASAPPGTAKTCCPKPDYARQRCCSGLKCYHCCVPKAGADAPRPTRRWYDCGQEPGVHVYRARVQPFSCCAAVIRSRAACCARALRLNGGRARCCYGDNYATLYARTSVVRASRRGASLACGKSRYRPRKQLCCRSRRRRRPGVFHKCCGRAVYDSLRRRCCRGDVVRIVC